MISIGTLRDADSLQDSAVGDDNLGGTLSGLRSVRLDLLDNIHALDNLSEDDVLAVQPGGLGSADEELAAVGVGAGVGHRQDAGSGVLQGEVLVLELVAVDALASGSVVVGEVTALAHEVGDHPVKRTCFNNQPRTARLFLFCILRFSD